MTYTLSSLSIFCYLFSAIVQSRHLFAGKSINRPIVIIACIIGVSLHCATLITLIHSPVGLDFSIFRALSLVGLFLMVLTLSTILRRPIDNLLILSCPIAALSVALSLINTSPIVLQNAMTPGIILHIASSILAFSVFCMAFIQAIVLFMQEKELKLHHLTGIIQRLPPLQTMTTMLFELIWIGMIMLSLSLLTGVLFIDDLLAQHLAHKTVLSVFAWIIFAILLWGHYHQGWRSYTVLTWTISGFLLLLMGYFGSKIVLELILNKV